MATERLLILDTETTGLNVKDGHRIIEIGALEIIERRVTGRTYHQYIQPDRAVDEGAFAVHGISDEFLQNQPRFAEIMPAFLQFIEGAILVIHNAPFDLGFLNHELALVDKNAETIDQRCEIIDSLALARHHHPGQRNSLDALCGRYNINNDHRKLHGALLDAEILADVYLAMTGGQVSLLGGSQQEAQQQTDNQIRRLDPDRPRLPVLQASAAALEAHQAYLEQLEKSSQGRCVWLHLTDETAH